LILSASLVAPSPRAPHLSVHALPERRIGKHRGGLGQSQADQSSVFGHRASGPISSSGWPKSPGLASVLSRTELEEADSDASSLLADD